MLLEKSLTLIHRITYKQCYCSCTNQLQDVNYLDELRCCEDVMCSKIGDVCVDEVLVGMQTG